MICGCFFIIATAFVCGTLAPGIGTAYIFVFKRIRLVVGFFRGNPQLDGFDKSSLMGFRRFDPHPFVQSETE